MTHGANDDGDPVGTGGEAAESGECGAVAAAGSECVDDGGARGGLDGLDDPDDSDGLDCEDAGREPAPSDSLRTFGAFVHGLREHAGLSRAELGELVRYSKYTVESVEQGRRMPDDDFVELAETATGNTGALRRAARFLTRSEVGLAAWFRQWARLERIAVSLCTYECRLVPGLLQSEAYARAVFDNSIPLLSDDQLEAQVAARLKRQKTLYDRMHVPFSFIVEEHAFRRQLGGAEVTCELLDHALELSRLRNVTLQVMPLVAESHGCLDGPVRLLETPKHKRYAYSEGQQNGRLISDPQEVRLLYQRYDTLRSQALNPKDSRGLLERLRGEL